INEEERHQGYGTLFFKFLVSQALEMKCVRFEWNCLNWNQPSIDFYLSLGAKPLDDWTTFRMITSDMQSFLKDKKGV
ncbi:MAG: GNAT family N-acetyltransferase, partial [Acholeplasmataceae bacterium]